MHSDSPEEKLLRLIKKKSDVKAEPGKTAPEKFLSRFQFSLAGIASLNKRLAGPAFLKKVELALLGIFAAALAYLIYSLFFWHLMIPPIGPNGAAPETAVTAGQTQAAPDNRIGNADGSSYEKYIAGRNIFSSSGGSSIEAEIAPADVSKKFNLVGVLPGDKPQAVIEDANAQKTYYLFQGQSFDGATVEEIGEGRVVINYRGSRIILVL